MTDQTLFDALRAVVQYRRKDGGSWTTMAAFDAESVADKYAADCSEGDRPWEYRVVNIRRDETP